MYPEYENTNSGQLTEFNKRKEEFIDQMSEKTQKLVDEYKTIVKIDVFL